MIDEVGYTRLTPEQAHHLFELVTARYERGSILLTSNTSFAEWGNLTSRRDPRHRLARSALTPR